MLIFQMKILIKMNGPKKKMILLSKNITKQDQNGQKSANF